MECLTNRTVFGCLIRFMYSERSFETSKETEMGIMQPENNDCEIDWDSSEHYICRIYFVH